MAAVEEALGSLSINQQDELVRLSGAAFSPSELGLDFGMGREEAAGRLLNQFVANPVQVAPFVGGSLIPPESPITTLPSNVTDLNVPTPVQPVEETQPIWKRALQRITETLTPDAEARKFVQSLHLDNWKEWRQFAKSGKLPNDVPRNPDEVYKNKGWINYVDWIGKDPKFSRIMKFRSFKDARRFARKLKLKSSKAWPKYCKSGKKPDDIPRNPDNIYKKEWTGWGDFLGTGRVGNKDRKYRS